MFFFSGETKKWGRQFSSLSREGNALLFLSCVNGIGISWAGINVQQYVSATTFTVLANVNKFVVVGFGMLVLKESGSTNSVLGCTLALLGGVAYVRARQRLSNAKELHQV